MGGIFICIICKKHSINNSKNILETNNFIISHGPVESQILGYIYIEPKRHIENWSEFSSEELAEIAPIIKRIEILLKQTLKAERVYTVTISESVRHIHFHIIPRLFDQDLRGIRLIEQATQQRTLCNKKLSEEQVNAFIVEAKKFLN